MPRIRSDQAHQVLLGPRADASSHEARRGRHCGPLATRAEVHADAGPSSTAMHSPGPAECRWVKRSCLSGLSAAVTAFCSVSCLSIVSYGIGLTYAELSFATTFGCQDMPCWSWSLQAESSLPQAFKHISERTLHPLVLRC